MLTICFLRSMSPDDVRQRVRAFSSEYARDWECWLRAQSRYGLTGSRGILEFGRILRKWQAARPYPMRRPKADRDCGHQPPYLDDLVLQAQRYLEALGDATVRDADRLWTQEMAALAELWCLFGDLPYRGTASCVGITKAVMFQTCGRIGPSLDRRVRDNLGLGKPKTAEEWLEVLHAIAVDMRVFEETHSLALEDIVEGGSRIGIGRIFDMIAWS